MTKFEIVKAEWLKAFSELNAQTWFQRLASGDVQLKHYKAYLRETYFQTGHNPQIQAVSTGALPSSKQKVVYKIFQHAMSEIGHDLLALNDLKALGHDISKIPNERPLPSTMSLVAFPLYLIHYVNPVGYLGYLFHLEVMPTTSGMQYVEILKKMGVPESAVTFIEEHAKVDEYHIQNIAHYLEELVTTKEELDLVIYAAKATCHLHGRMLIDAFERVDGLPDLYTF